MSRARRAKHARHESALVLNADAVLEGARRSRCGRRRGSLPSGTNVDLHLASEVAADRMLSCMSRTFPRSTTRADAAAVSTAGPAADVRRSRMVRRERRDGAQVVGDDSPLSPPRRSRLGPVPRPRLEPSRNRARAGGDGGVGPNPTCSGGGRAPINRKLEPHLTKMVLADQKGFSSSRSGGGAWVRGEKPCGWSSGRRSRSAAETNPVA